MFISIVKNIQKVVYRNTTTILKKCEAPGNLENPRNQKEKENNLEPKQKKKKSCFFLIGVVLGSQTIQSIYHSEVYKNTTEFNK